MDIFKAIAKQEVAAHGSVAIRADQKSYSYNQLISSAQKLSNLLCENDVKVVWAIPWIFFTIIFVKWNCIWIDLFSLFTNIST